MVCWLAIPESGGHLRLYFVACRAGSCPAPLTARGVPCVRRGGGVLPPCACRVLPLRSACAVCPKRKGGGVVPPPCAVCVFSCSGSSQGQAPFSGLVQRSLQSPFASLQDRLQSPCTPCPAYAVSVGVVRRAGCLVRCRAQVVQRCKVGGYAPFQLD